MYIRGFTCQSFSRARNAKVFGDDDGKIFYSVLGYIVPKQSRIFIVENVKDLATLDNGKHAAKSPKLYKLGVPKMPQKEGRQVELMTSATKS